MLEYLYSKILRPSHPSYLSAYKDWTECSETSEYKIQTPENYPEESIQHSEHSESLKSRRLSDTHLKEWWIYSISGSKWMHNFSDNL